MSTSAAAKDHQRTLAKRLLPLLDLTSLDERDTTADIEALCARARTPHGSPAALCVYPEHVATARRGMHGTSARIATVVNFPAGWTDAARAAAEATRAIAAGADEIDMVLPYRALCAGDSAAAAAVVHACRRTCGDQVVLKLILETGELATPARIREACAVGLGEGVDFLKTSTGKSPVGATPEAATIVLDAIAASGGTCGFKPSGGVRTLAAAATYLDLAASRLGDAWITPAHVRIGASILFTDILHALAPL